MKRFASRRALVNVVLVAVAGALIAGGIATLGPQSSSARSSSTTSTVTKGTVLSSVSATGNVAASASLALNFMSGGQLVAVDVKPGQAVKAGQALAKIDPTDAQNAVDNAQASLTSAQANLQQLLDGETPAQRAQDAVSLQQAQQQVSSAQVAVANAQANANQDAVALQTAVNQAQAQVNSDKAASPVDQSKVTQDENALADARNNQASGAMKDQQQVQQADLSLQGAQLSLRNTQAGIAVKQEPPQPGTLAQAQAGVVQAQTGLASAQKTLAETTLSSPTAGTIATVSASVGDTVAGGGASGSSSSSSSSSSSGTGGSGTGGSGATGTGATASTGSSSTGSSSTGSSSTASSSGGFVTLTNLDTLQVTAGFSESDAVKVKVGQPAVVTFSALPTVAANARVVAIALTSTVVSNVVTYDVTVDFDGRVGSVKPGMTASVAVTTAEADNVLTLPASAVPTSGTTGTVQVQQSNGKVVSKTIGIGLRGDNSVEITSGLAAGDKVVTTVASVGTGTGAGTGLGTGAGARFGGGGLGGLGGGIGR